MLFIGENNTIQNLAKEKPKRKITHAALAKKNTKPKEGVDSTCREDV